MIDIMYVSLSPELEDSVCELCNLEGEPQYNLNHYQNAEYFIFVRE